MLFVLFINCICKLRSSTAFYLHKVYVNIFGPNFAGEFQIGDNITPLDPETVESVVQYGMYGFPISDEATGYSLVYNQLYPFEGLQNYTSGIIHHVCLTGITSHVISAHLGRFKYSSQMTD